MNINVDRISARNTEEFLHLFSSHLSSRPECRRVEYTVMICKDNTIWCLPNISVFPNRYTRKEQSRESILKHIMTHHFNEIYDGTNSYGCVRFKPGSLVPGGYKYQLSFDDKRRKWVTGALLDQPSEEG